MNCANLSDSINNANNILNDLPTVLNGRTIKIIFENNNLRVQQITTPLIISGFYTGTIELEQETDDVILYEYNSENNFDLKNTRI